MGVRSSTLRVSRSSRFVPIRQPDRMGASSSTSRKKITEADPMETSASSSQVNKTELSKTNSLIDGSLVFGRENEKQRIIEFMLSDYCQNRNVSVICIVGADGIGKTTMVQLVYTDQRVEDAFDARVFIGMSEKFDEKRLMKAILESLTGVPCDITEPSILEDIVKDELAGKKLLLVLDSVESENKSSWDNLLVRLSVVAQGSVILVTTSRWEVADVAGATNCYPLDYLSDINCWLIFEQLAFSGTNQNAQSELVNIGKRLISKCASNALCIKMLGGLLSCLVTEVEWRSVLESFSWYMNNADGDIVPILRVWYEFLPLHMKECFVYCSLFPKGYIFSKHHVARLWLAQGFIEPVVGRNIEDVGLQCFEELCSRYFFYHSPLHDSKDDKFMMHDLVHDLAQSVSKNVCFRSEDCVQIIPKGLRHLSLVPSEYQTVTVNLLTEEAKDLQSFLVVNRSMFQTDTLSRFLYFVGLNDLFVKCRSLRALDLSNTDINELPNSIEVMTSLYSLSLSNTKIRSIPQEIGSLINLHSFEAKDCYNLVELPECISDLAKLHHLDVTKEAGFVGMPVGIRKMTNLQSLPTFNVGSEEIHCGIEELKDLTNLKGSLQICGIENVTSSLDAKEANLKSKGNLEKLSLQWSDNTVMVEEDEDTELQETVLENLQPTDNLQELTIRNYMGCQFPLWIGDPSFSKLVSLILDGCPNCNSLPVLGALPALRYLSLHRLYGVDTMEVSKFPSLELLNLSEMYELKEWPEIGEGDFPLLRSVSVSKCPLLKTIPHFPSLVELSLHYCNQLPNIANHSSIESLRIEGFSDATCLYLPQNLIALRKLEVSRCSELLLLEGLSKLTSIEVFKVIQCPKLDLGDWKSTLLKSDDTSKLEFKELEAYDKDISESKATRPKDLPIEEILAKEMLEKENLKEFIERLKQDIQTLEEGGDDKITDEPMVELGQLMSYCKRAIKDLEVSLEVARGHVDSLETDYMSLWLKEIEALKGADAFPHPKEHLARGTGMSKPCISVFSKKELKKATQNFSDSLKIGEGGSGSVYKGFLQGIPVAVKRLRGVSSKGFQEYNQERDILCNLSHPNIVTLVGVCNDPVCIIYEYLPNQSLDRFLDNSNNTPPLSWQICTRIIAEVCSALMYLHSNNPHPVVHRDVKPSNILLDANFVSKLTDFGISRTLEISKNSDTTRVMGTVGYVDPDYLTTGHLTLRSDIYSFGITILVIVTRKRPIDMKMGGIREAVVEALIGGRSQLYKLVGDDWPLEQAKLLLNLGVRCADIDGAKRQDLATEIWPVIRKLLKAASISLPHCEQYPMKTMQGPSSSRMFHERLSSLKIVEWKDEIEEILVREKHVKDLIEEEIEELSQKMKLLERRQASKGKKHEMVQPSSEGVPQDLQVTEDISSLSYLPPITEFSSQEVEAATQNFSDLLKIGGGGFGSVYKGSLHNTTVAIKMLRSPTEQGQSEFKQEIAVLSRTRHPHLITLVGMCSKPWCLIYEYLPNGSLEDRLSRTNNTAPLPWHIRTKIIGEICSSLMFLHSPNPHLVIHGDLKPSNILLDANLVCKLSDFGISHLVEQFHARTTTFFYYTQPKGTFAYMDPEFATTGRLTPQSDIYAFGIIILRLITGRPPLGIALVVEEALEEDKLQSLIDTSAGEWPFEQAQILAKLGLRCANLRRRLRPDLASVVWTTIEPLFKDVETS